MLTNRGARLARLPAARGRRRRGRRKARPAGVSVGCTRSRPGAPRCRHADLAAPVAPSREVEAAVFSPARRTAGLSATDGVQASRSSATGCEASSCGQPGNRVCDGRHHPRSPSRQVVWRRGHRSEPAGERQRTPCTRSATRSG